MNFNLSIFKNSKTNSMDIHKVNYKNLIILGIMLYFIGNFILKLLGLSSTIFYGFSNMLFELIIVLYGLFLYRGNPIKRQVLYVILGIFCVQMISYQYSNIVFDFRCIDSHRLLLFAGMIVVTYFIAREAIIPKKDFEFILNLLIGLGFFAIIYNIILNWNVFSTLNLRHILYNSHHFKSIFNARAPFAMLLCICSVILIYKYKSERKITTLLLFIFFAVNLIIVNSRTFILPFLIIFLLEIFNFLRKYKIKEPKKFKYLIIILLVAFVLLFVIFYDYIDTIVFHNGSIFNGRDTLIKDVFSGVDFISFFIGHGIGSCDAYLSNINSPFASPHNYWITLFFEGGIIFVILYFSFFISLFYRIRSIIDENIRFLFYSFTIITIISGLFEAIASPFLADTSSILGTLITFTLPLSLINGLDKDEMKYSNNGENDEKKINNL